MPNGEKKKERESNINHNGQQLAAWVVVLLLAADLDDGAFGSLGRSIRWDSRVHRKQFLVPHVSRLDPLLELLPMHSTSRILPSSLAGKSDGTERSIV